MGLLSITSGSLNEYSSSGLSVLGNANNSSAKPLDIPFNTDGGVLWRSGGSLVTTLLTTLGTVSTGLWNASIISPEYGGTGVSNNISNTITFSGNYGITLNLTDDTSLSLPVSGTLATTSQLPTSGRIVFNLDGGGNVLTTGSKAFLPGCIAGTINGWYVTADQSGSVVVDIKRSGTSIIGGSGNKPTLSSAQRSNASISNWTSTELSEGDELEFYIDSVSTITKLFLTIYYTKT